LTAPKSAPTVTPHEAEVVKDHALPYVRLVLSYVLSMSSLVWLGLAVFFVVVVALTGAGPKGGKPVARTRLMGTARVFLIGGIVVSAALALMGALRH
jgi:hypothetical protein